jgi:3-oxoadipate enol-lactonase
MPPARTLTVPGRGELFLRDTGGDGPAVLLLHGWIASSDLNWWGAYGDLAEAGYRVLAIDHRGHGRGLRPLVPFTLEDCAADAAAAIRQLGVAPAAAVGYSMGGAIAQLMARDHPDAVTGIVLSGTAQHWQDPQSQRVFRTMGALGLALSLAPRANWRRGLGRVGIPESRQAVWLQSELMRHSARDIAQAGRELARFDSRTWLGSVDVNAAVVVTTKDDAVPASRQRELAAALGAPMFDADVRHLEIVTRRDRFNPALLRALSAVAAAHGAKVT